MAEPDSGSHEDGDGAEPRVDADDDRTADRRTAVEEVDEFEDFTPADMEAMSAEEWDAAFDPDSWITGTELLDRVEADLNSRVARRNVFAVVERTAEDGEDRLLAYSNEGYAVVYPDGSVEGRGTVLRDVKPVVALCSMDDYEVPEPPEGSPLPHPDTIAGGSGELGNRLVQFVALVQIVAGGVLVFSPLVTDLGRGSSVLLTTVVGFGFILIGAMLLLLVANARLSDRFRAEEYRDRLRSTGVGTDERPDFLPLDDGHQADVRADRSDEEREQTDADGAEE